MLHQVSNTRATIGKYRNLTSTDWQAVQARISSTNGKASITTSNGREVSFTRAEVEYLTQKYGTARA
jgi:hypothetical protein